MTVNARLRELYPDSEELFDIVLMTNNHAQVGVRLINSINHYGMLHHKPNIVDCLSMVAAAATGVIKNRAESSNYTLEVMKSCYTVIRVRDFFPHTSPSCFHTFRFDHREILYDRRAESYRLPEGLHDKPVSVQGLGESHRGHRGR